MSSKKTKHKDTPFQEENVSVLDQLQNQQFYLTNSIQALRHSLETLEHRLDVYVKLCQQVTGIAKQETLEERLKKIKKHIKKSRYEE